MFIPYIIIFSIIVVILFLKYFPRYFSQKDKEILLNYYSSLLSDMNIDYQNEEISPKNIRNIGTSIENFTNIIESYASRMRYASTEKRAWFLSIVEEFQKALSLWTERHADEIVLYESKLDDENAPSITLLKKRLETESQNMRLLL